MRSSALYILFASSRLLCTPVFTIVHALPCVQNDVSVSSSSSSHPLDCPMTFDRRSGPIENSTSDKSSIMSTQRIDSSQQPYFTPTLVLALVLFITFASLLVVLLFFGPSVRSYLLQKWRKEEKPKLGFCFDGLSKEELKGLRLKEEKEATKSSWFIKLPTRPPALVLKHPPSPLLPIQIPSDRSQTVAMTSYRK